MKKNYLICLFILVPALMWGKVRLHPVFSSNMVLQQKTDAPIWGKATPNRQVTVTVSWDNKKYSATAAPDSAWRLSVKTPEAGGPYTVTVSDGQTLTLDNVMIGEVWICSGQSNMEMPLAGWGKIKNYEQEIAAANYPNIRLLTVGRAVNEKPLSDLNVGKGWQVCSPATIAEFSATGYFFGRDLNQTFNIPIGLINSSWGGTIAEAWTSAESLNEMPDFVEPVKTVQDYAGAGETAADKYIRAVSEWMDKVKLIDPGYSQNLPEWAALNFRADGWKTMILPGFWEEKGLDEVDGMVWFRKTIIIPSKFAGKELTLSLGAIDDNDVTFFNGVEVGHVEGDQKHRVYKVPANLVTKGEAIIAVRAHDTGGKGGLSGPADKMFLQLKTGEKISLSGEWQYQISLEKKKIPTFPANNFHNPNRPTVLFNGMINPLLPYAIKGAIWYQGEANAARAYQYRELLPLLISDWRKQWGHELPFYFVQLAAFRKAQPEPAESEWAELREAQTKTLALNNTGMAVTIDIGEANDLHPKNKQDVGRRLALAARALTYGQSIQYSGPAYKNYKIEGNKIRIYFDHANGMTPSSGDKVKGFAIAGRDHKFHWAEAVIDAQTSSVIVSCPEVAYPIAVRYGWADNPDCNLVNGAGLPASPFRTDEWQGITK